MSTPTTRVRILRSATLPNGVLGEVAVGIDPPHDIFTVWRCGFELLPANIHPGIAAVVGRILLEGQPGWLEQRSGLTALRDLRLPLDSSLTAHILAGVADGLAALHALGLAHGAIGLDTVSIDSACVPTLLGAGACPGTAEGDLKAASALIEILCGHPLPHRPGSAEDIATSLREWLITVNAPPPEHPEEATTATRPMDGRILALDILPMGTVDEVQPDIGRDATGRGLLDRWSHTDASDDLTEDRTETVDATELHARAQRSMREGLNALYPDAEPQHRLPTATPSTGIRSLLQREPLDPLPIPEGMPHAEVLGGEEPVEEVTASPQTPSPVPPPPVKAAAPVTPDEPPRARVLTMVILGMVGASATLVLAWFLLALLSV